jgi:hypothetical protein
LPNQAQPKQFQVQWIPRLLLFLLFLPAVTRQPPFVPKAAHQAADQPREFAEGETVPLLPQQFLA